MSKIRITATMLAGMVLAAAPVSVNAREKLTGEERLAKELEGREAGKPVTCISTTASDNTQVIDKTALIYRVGGTLYVNRPQNADQLDSDSILVTRLYSSQVCRLDTVQLRSRTMPTMWQGFVTLQDFVPYTRIKKDDQSK